MKALLLAALLQAAPSSGSISGTVIELGSPYRKPLVNARVELSPDLGACSIIRTNLDGQFVFSNLSNGRYRLTVWSNGYIRKSSVVSLGGDHHSQDVDLALEV